MSLNKFKMDTLADKHSEEELEAKQENKKVEKKEVISKKKK